MISTSHMLCRCRWTQQQIFSVLVPTWWICCPFFCMTFETWLKHTRFIWKQEVSRKFMGDAGIHYFLFFLLNQTRNYNQTLILNFWIPTRMSELQPTWTVLRTWKLFTNTPWWLVMLPNWSESMTQKDIQRM